MPAPLVLSTVNPKGGTGKSTVAVHLAVAAHRDGYEVTLFDTDPQGSAWDWHRRAPDGYDGPHVEKVGQKRTLAAAIGQTDAQMIVIDSPARLNERSDRVLTNADLALVPVRPSGVDLWATAEFLEILNEHVEEGLTAAFVGSQKDVRTTLSDELTDVLSRQGLPLLDGLAFRVAYARSMSEGQTVLDGYDSKAASEVRTLLQDVSDLLT